MKTGDKKIILDIEERKEDTEGPEVAPLSSLWLLEFEEVKFLLAKREPLKEMHHFNKQKPPF